MSPVMRLLIAVALGLPALVLLLPRIAPGAEISLWLMRERRARRRQRQVDLPRAAKYHELLPESDRSAAIGDRAWRDLNLDDVFVSLDNTESEPGRQYLYHLLRTPRPTAKPLERLEQLVQRISTDDAVAERLHSSLRRLNDPRAGELVQLILGELPYRPTAWWVFPLLTATSIACLALIPIWPRALMVSVAVCLVNVAIQVFYKSRVKRFVPALHELPGFIGAARSIGTMQIAEASEEVESLRHGARTLGILRRATWWLMFEPGETNELAASLYEYVNLLFLLDVNAFVFALESLRASQRMMRAMFESIGYLDAARSIVIWRASLPQWTLPAFTAPMKAMDVESVVHPLVDTAVPNTLDVDGVSVLITGSNMSGKTTFVRALGVNAVLAQTLHTVCASSWTAPFVRVLTSIERADSIREGKSYYLAEVESVRSLVRAKEDGVQHLFLLDEIFRGTNTTERIAAAYAVLRYLNRGLDLVVVATHDVEVLELLGDEYAPLHFREHIVDGTLMFDYRIQPGPASTRNAIALLELMQFPRDLVSDALATLDGKADEPFPSPRRVEHFRYDHGDTTNRNGS
jgi:hypothetical protein